MLPDHTSRIEKIRREHEKKMAKIEKRRQASEKKMARIEKLRQAAEKKTSAILWNLGKPRKTK